MINPKWNTKWYSKYHSQMVLNMRKESLETLKVTLGKNHYTPLEFSYQFLRQAILNNLLGPGFRIVERDIAEILNVSRTPVREAIRLLESESLVERTPNRGAVVLGFDTKDILELYELRMVLENFVVQVVADKAARDELLAFRKKLEECDLKSSHDDFDFHRELVKLTKNTWLQRVLIPLVEYIHHFRLISILEEGRSDKARREHIRIVSYLLEGRKDKAMELLDSHIREAYQALVAMTKGETAEALEKTGV
jgi:DNA-binding GntR family transcriptional regulator